MTSQPAGADGAQVLPPGVLKFLASAQVRVNRLSRGRFGNRRKGRDVCFVTMTGAVSGRTLTKPLMYVPYG
jgi:hypothetical protein